MLRKLILLGVFSGIAAAIPVVLDNNGVFQPGPASAPTRPAEVAPRAEIALSGRKIRIEADELGHFSGQFMLNGRPVRALVDTGATLVAINRSTANRLGLHLSPGDFRHKARTANGAIAAAAVILERVEIGRVSVANVQAMVIDDKSLSETLIGMSFLKQLSRYAVTEGALVLEQ
ncbi:MAG: TIGR02281 family clan AA aspartic protease [Phyllobacteriaceae bacterium]|nr:TIGR02281 family clan AA aspartic protease [Phyllobacteriaceae bacterium]